MPGSYSHLVRASIVSVMLVTGSMARADDVADVQRRHASGQTAAAMQQADAYLAAHPKDAAMRFVKGVMLADEKRDTEAIVVFEKLSEDYPDLAEPYNNLAVLYARGGDYAKARATLELALRTNPSYATALENLGDVYAALAAQSYTRTLKLDPGNASVPPKLAIVRELYRRSGQPGIAAAALAANPK